MAKHLRFVRNTIVKEVLPSETPKCEDCTTDWNDFDLDNVANFNPQPHTTLLMIHELKSLQNCDLDVTNEIDNKICKAVSFSANQTGYNDLIQLDSHDAPCSREAVPVVSYNTKKDPVPSITDFLGYEKPLEYSFHKTVLPDPPSKVCNFDGHSLYKLKQKFKK